MYYRVLYAVLLLLAGCEPKDTSDQGLDGSTQPDGGTASAGKDASLDGGGGGDAGTKGGDAASEEEGATGSIDITVGRPTGDARQDGGPVSADGGEVDGSASDAGTAIADASVTETDDAGTLDGGSDAFSSDTSSDDSFTTEPITTDTVITDSVSDTSSTESNTTGDTGNSGSEGLDSSSADGGVTTRADGGDQQSGDGGEVSTDSGVDPVVLPTAPNNTASAVGDPHILTFDGLAYDMQGVGEFTATRDPNDGFEVQIRTAALNGTNIAVNTAVAMRVGENTLGFYRDGTERLNGVDAEFAAGENPLVGGGSVWIVGDTVTVVWPDNSQVQFTRRSTFISVYAHVADGHAGDLVGLFGDFDGETDEDLATRSGMTLDNPTDFATFYGVFVESWRVGVETSLFDYAEGEDSETFTDRSFPSNLASVSDLEEQVSNDAEAVCTSANVAEQWLDACILDFGLTGDEDYVADLSQTPVPRAVFVVEQVADLCSIPADRVCVEQAVYVVDGCTRESTLQETCSGDAVCSGGFCLTPVSAALRGLVKDAATDEPVSGVLVVVKRDGLPVVALTTGSSGLYAEELDPGQYELVFSREGYLETTLLVELEPGHATTVTALRQVKVPDEEGTTGDISGRIVNSVTGAAVAGLAVSLRPGINVISGETLATTETDSNGSYALAELPPGNYTITVSGTGFLDSHFDVVVLAGETVAGQDASVTPILNDGELRIVLTWGESPSDLDSHLYTPAIDGTSYHVYYGAQGSTEAVPFSGLDLDDTTGNGPETVTIAQAFPGTYVYAVHNFSRSPALAGSGATVAVYTEDGLARTYVVPTSGEGEYWTVFQLNGETGEITTVDSIGTSVVTPPTTGDDGADAG